MTHGICTDNFDNFVPKNLAILKYITERTRSSSIKEMKNAVSFFVSR